MDEYRKCAWMGCKNVFIPRDPRQIYCCKACSDKAREFRRYRPRKKNEKPARHVCDREDCLIYTLDRANHCMGLSEIPEDLTKCSFYKTKE